MLQYPESKKKKQKLHMRVLMYVSFGEYHEGQGHIEPPIIQSFQAHEKLQPISIILQAD